MHGTGNFLSFVSHKQTGRALEVCCLSLILFIVLNNAFCFIPGWYSLIPSASPCTGFKAGTAGSPAAPRQTDEPLHGPCPASAPSMAARRRSWELAGLPAAGFVSSVPQLEKWENAQGHLPQTVSHSSTLSCLEQA